MRRSRGLEVADEGGQLVQIWVGNRDDRRAELARQVRRLSWLS